MKNDRPPCLCPLGRRGGLSCGRPWATGTCPDSCSDTGLNDLACRMIDVRSCGTLELRPESRSLVGVLIACLSKQRIHLLYGDERSLLHLMKRRSVLYANPQGIRAPSLERKLATIVAILDPKKCLAAVGWCERSRRKLMASFGNPSPMRDKTAWTIRPHHQAIVAEGKMSD